jgi:hypothetical protein
VSLVPFVPNKVPLGDIKYVNRERKVWHLSEKVLEFLKEH